MNIPAWHPQQPLTAEDFLKWEEYILARAAFAGPDPGLESTGPEPVTTNGEVFRVTDVTGLTGCGHPVVISGDESLECPAENGNWDLFIEVHTARSPLAVAATSPEVVRPPKYRLVIFPPDDGSLTLDRQPHRLYLGRWKKDGTNADRLNIPLPRKLIALRPLLGERAWEEWVGELLITINAMIPVQRQEILSAVAWVADAPLSETVRALSAIALREQWIEGPLPSLPVARSFPLSLVADDLVNRLCQLTQIVVDGDRPYQLDTDYTLKRQSDGSWALVFLKELTLAELGLSIPLQGIKPTIRIGPHGGPRFGWAGNAYLADCATARADGGALWILYNLPPTFVPAQAALRRHHL